MSTHRHRNSTADSIPAGVQTAISVVFFGLGGLVFCALSCVYLYEGIGDLRRDEFELAVGSSRGIEWHRTFSVADHPVLFALRILLDITGAVGALGIGLIIIGALISISAKNPGPVSRKMEGLGKPCLIIALITFGAHFALTTIPFLMALADRI